MEGMVEMEETKYNIELMKNVDVVQQQQQQQQLLDQQQQQMLSQATHELVDWWVGRRMSMTAVGVDNDMLDCSRMRYF